MARSLGRKSSNSQQQQLSDTESSSEDENSFAANMRINSLHQNASCNHSNCANKFPLGANQYGKNNGVDDDDDDDEEVACGASCSYSNQENSSSICSSLSIYNNASHKHCVPPECKNTVSGNNNISVSWIPEGCKSGNIPSVNNSQSLLMTGGIFLEYHVARTNEDEVPAMVTSYRSNSQSPAVNMSLLNTVEEAYDSPNLASCRIQGYIDNGHELIPSSRVNGNTRANDKEMNISGTRDKLLYQQLDSQIAANNYQIPSSGAFYNWQAAMTTVKERFAFLFNNEILSDVHFRVGKGESSQRIPAHKFVLSVGSAVFDAMFNGKLCARQDEIELPDVEPQAFLALLKFLYSDEVQIGPESVMTVLYTAKKYAVPALERHCVDFLKCNLSSDNAFMLLTQARLFDEPQLATLCLDTIDKNTSDALMADGFTDIDHNTLCSVLERDTLRIRESKLFQAVVRWAEAQCERENIVVNGTNQRKILGRALSLVRFPLMTIEEFAQGPAQSNILKDKEIVQLFLYFTVNPKPPVNFLDAPRCCMTGKEQKVCRFPQTESRWGYSGTSDRIRFIVDRKIFVVGFGMYGSTHGPAEYEITIQIIHTATGKVCASNDTTFISDGSVHTFRVMFKEPVEVLPNTNYTAYATLKGPDSHYGTKGVRKITVECPSGDRVTFQFTYAAGNNNGTSVEDGQIPEIIFYT